jgi:hypothetical protein
LSAVLRFVGGWLQGSGDLPLVTLIWGNGHTPELIRVALAKSNLTVPLVDPPSVRSISARCRRDGIAI